MVRTAESQLLEEVLELEEPSERMLRLETGEVLKLEGAPGGETLRFYSRAGELLLEYDPAGQKTRINVPKGDLQLIAEQGNIDLAAAGDVRLWGNRSVQLGSGAAPGNRTSVDLRPSRLRLEGPLLSLFAKEGELRLDQMRYLGKRVQGTVEDARLALDRLTVVADRVKSTAKNVYHRVENLWQTHAGRARTIVDGSFHTKAAKLFLKAKTDAKVKAEKIHLG